MPIATPREPHQRLAFGVEPSDRQYRLRLARYPALAETLAAFADRRGATSARPVALLDAGVGRGRTLRYLEPSGRADAFTYFGVDLEATLAARVYRRERWRLVRGDVARPLPFRSASFDVAVCEQVLEHVDDPAGALRELARCLRPGGLLVVGVPTFPPGVRALRRVVAPLAHRASSAEHGHVQSFTAGTLRRLVRDTGFLEVIDVRGFRVVSGGPLSRLEDQRWWWRANAAFGRALPSLCTEVQVVAERNDTPVAG